mmetsp:Transcript_34206/g.6169  ORF Transcript_34206/g.6169 Transcript_34206/m.6169 type:complete len:89 (-) Transcript_34206:193-459(-)
MISSLSVFPLIDRCGRKPLLIIGEIGMGVFLVLIGLFQGPLDLDYPLLHLTCTLMFIIFFEMSLGPIVWVYCSEVLYAKGMSLSTAAN